MEQVRELGAAEAHLDEETIRAARAVLTREIARGGRAKEPVRARRRRWTGIGIGGLVAGAAAVAVVVGSVLTPPAAPSAVAGVLGQAAAAAARQEIAPASGQYIRLRTTGEQRLWWTVDPASTAGGRWGIQPTDTSALVRSARSLYVPADRSQDWVEDYRESIEISDLRGPVAESAGSVAAREALMEGVAPFGVRVYPGGTFTQPDATDPTMLFQRDWMQPHYDTMPRDPEKLIQWMKAQKDGSLTRFGDAVGFDLAPADLRAAMFRALALIPGAKVADVEDGVATVVYPDGGESNRPQTVLVDTKRGLIVGTGGGATDVGAARIEVTIVDALPDSVKLPEK